MNTIPFQYLAKFGEELKYPPYDYGRVDMSEEELLQYAKAALAAGKPIDWGDHFKLLDVSTDS